jgi:hypothetical protein
VTMMSAFSYRPRAFSCAIRSPSAASIAASCPS